MFLWLYCPETKGLTLEEINTLFGDVVVVDINNDDTGKAVIEHNETEKQQDKTAVNSA